MNAIGRFLQKGAVAMCLAALPLTAAAIYPVSAHPDVRTEIGYRLFSGEATGFTVSENSRCTSRPA